MIVYIINNAWYIDITPNYESSIVSYSWRRGEAVKEKFPWHIKLVFHFFQYKYLISFSCHFNNLKWRKNGEPFFYSYFCCCFTFLFFPFFSDKLFVGLLGWKREKIVCCLSILMIVGQSLSECLNFLGWQLPVLSCR